MTTLTWDEAPARRPELADVGGLEFENDDEFPPPTTGEFAGTFPTANILNQSAAQVVALARMVPALVLQLSYISNAPFVSNAHTPGALLDDFNPFQTPFVWSVAPFTVTENAVGDVSISWPAGTFAANNTFFAVGCVHAVTPQSLSLSFLPHGVRAFTFDSAGAGVRAAFTCVIY